MQLASEKRSEAARLLHLSGARWASWKYVPPSAMFLQLARHRHVSRTEPRNPQGALLNFPPKRLLKASSESSL